MSPEQQIERSMLAGKDRDELHTIASAVGVKSATRMRKADLVEAILVAANGDTAAASPDDAGSGNAGSGNAGSGNGSATNGSSDATAKPRRAVRPPRASQLEEDPLAALAAEEDSLGRDDDDPLPSARVPSARRPRPVTDAEPEPARSVSQNGDVDASDGASGPTASVTTTRADD